MLSPLPPLLSGPQTRQCASGSSSSDAAGPKRTEVLLWLREDKRMTCDHLSRLLPLLLLLLLLLCAARAASGVRGAQSFKKKASILMREESQNPKCFVEGKNDFTCFWVEDEERAGSLDQYSFTYAYLNENGSCPLRVVPGPGGRRMFVCHVNQPPMFVPVDVEVRRGGQMIHNRSLQVDLIILLDPPSNVTVRRPTQQSQLNLSWLPPPLRYMHNSMMYEVLYGPADGPVKQVKETESSSQLVLPGLQPGTNYSVQLRVKLDGISYNGYWSAWSEPVFMETQPAELNPLIVSLIIIVSFIFFLLSLAILLLVHPVLKKFLIKKTWPTIPTPDRKFQGLFTVYDGNFEEWLGQTNGGLWLTPAFVDSEERPSPLEVLSELSLCPALQSPPLPPKTSRAPKGEKDSKGGPGERGPLVRGDLALSGWRPTPHNPWLIDRLRALHQNPVPCSQASLLESHDAYVTLNAKNRGEDEHLDDALEETSPLEVLFAGRKTTRCESHSDLGSVQQSSGSGRLSSQSSFEYPNHHAWTHTGPGYTYMAVADSGVSMDYSPMSRVDDIGKVVIYTNEYKNDVAAHRRPVLLRQYAVHEDG